MEQSIDIPLTDTYAKIVAFAKKHRLPLTDIRIMYNWVNYGAFFDSNNTLKLPVLPSEIIETIFYHAHAGLVPAQCRAERIFPDDCINFKITLKKPMYNKEFLYEHSKNVVKYLEYKGSIPIYSKYCFNEKSNKIYEIALIKGLS